MFGKRGKKHKYSSGPRELIVRNEPKSPVSEQYRTIRTNIMYSSVDNEMKTILFSSAAPNAGKSTTAANVAVAFAQAGNRTLLIDADLRRPTTHYTFEMNNARGLSSAIVGEAEIEQILRQTDVDNLDIITSGPVPPNPAELLQSKKMEHLLKTVNMQYDNIIIDSPPLLSVADAQILGTRVDGTILVVNSEDSDRDQLQKAKDLLNKTDTNIIGVVLNQRDMGSKDSYYYYYSNGE